MYGVGRSRVVNSVGTKYDYLCAYSVNAAKCTRLYIYIDNKIRKRKPKRRKRTTYINYTRNKF